MAGGSRVGSRMRAGLSMNPQVLRHRQPEAKMGMSDIGGDYVRHPREGDVFLDPFRMSGPHFAVFLSAAVSKSPLRCLFAS